jgi:copper homeostasis protein
MIRPRAGDFVYSSGELTAMHLRMAVAIGAGASGLVLGVLRPDRTVDVPCLRDLVQRAGDLPVTFHRAFDETPDLDVAMEEVIEAGVTRVLTAGGAPAASDGIDRLAALVQRAGSRATVLAGGGVRAHNVVNLIRRAGLREVHMRFEDEARTREVADLL